MSIIRRGDEELHHCDGRHRWTGGGHDPEVWRARMLEHLERHRSGEDREPRPLCGLPRVLPVSLTPVSRVRGDAVESGQDAA